MLQCRRPNGNRSIFLCLRSFTVSQNKKGRRHSQLSLGIRLIETDWFGFQQNWFHEKQWPISSSKIWKPIGSVPVMTEVTEYTINYRSQCQEKRGKRKKNNIAALIVTRPRTPPASVPLLGRCATTARTAWPLRRLARCCWSCPAAARATWPRRRRWYGVRHRCAWQGRSSVTWWLMLAGGPRDGGAREREGRRGRRGASAGWGGRPDWARMEVCAAAADCSGGNWISELLVQCSIYIPSRCWSKMG
jgi:hypothetical protein